MTVDKLENIACDCPHPGALLGLDVGKKTIGLALGDAAQGIATPLQTIKRTKFTQDLKALGAVVREFDVRGFVIGLPINMDGSEGPRAQSVRDFALELARYPDVVGASPWIALYDERLSTVSVEDFVDRSVEKRKTRVQAKDSGLIDRLAAQVILQSALDYIRN